VGVTVVWLAYGVGFAFALEAISPISNVDLGPAGILMARYRGSDSLESP